jgi:O-antigen biosynthesis protein
MNMSFTGMIGATAVKLSMVVDSRRGPLLPLNQLVTYGSEFRRNYGWRRTVGAVLRAIGVRYFPPLAVRINDVNKAVIESAIFYHYTYELTKSDGVVPSRRPFNEHDFALEMPLGYTPALFQSGPVAVVIHAFYLDALDALLNKVRNIPGRVDLFISTDREEKRAQIAALCQGWDRGAVEIAVTPNRGRDIAPKLIAFRDSYARYELFLHLHTKKSPHGGAPLLRWRDHLIDNLIGSPEIAAGIVSLFSDRRLGVVFPQHLADIRGILNWGYNYNMARALAQKMGATIDKNRVLEFPSGSMFWGRSAALRPLLDLNLTFDDFPEEDGRVDGTLAHAIERCILISAEAAHFEWLKVQRRDGYAFPFALLSAQRPKDLARHRLKIFRPCLSQVDDDVPPFFASLPEVAPIRSYPSRNWRPRLNLLINTINPHQAYGGVATALRHFSLWADALGEEFDRRIVVVDAPVEKEAYRAFSEYAPLPYVPTLDENSHVIVDATVRQGGALDLRENDIFIATAWWTEGMARAMNADRKRYFGKSAPFIYIIQDDEPYFSPWGSRFVLARESYFQKSEDEAIIPIVNSEELFIEMTGKYDLPQAFLIPYQLNEKISSSLKPTAREPRILVYGRPSVARNAFELICMALFTWQQADPIRASRWNIVFLGEDFPQSVIFPIQNATVAGKVALDLYADHLSRASVGISLMISPHPSYPPLEMAEAGLKVITNAFGAKDPRARFPDVLCLDRLTVATLAEVIERAVAEAEPSLGGVTPRYKSRELPAPGPIAEPEKIAQAIRAGLAQIRQS